ncbi:hypothetical protein IAW_05829 [Bacillus cereus str. Schrouff]|uniref:hypothetical protein n=1 Tax=Bacillus cereus TaxID=1396 RepID=UPI00032D8EBE|nr:hypothetical protein [Bacillus cereus]EOO05010.1 hypothetical protein IAW_05829 [Bacillus cereus str. Schrouff]EOO81656.1 hypothetical protein IGY_05678 [Bacillus cereus K-5975c]
MGKWMLIIFVSIVVSRSVDWMIKAIREKRDVDSMVEKKGILNIHFLRKYLVRLVKQNSHYFPLKKRNKFVLQHKILLSVFLLML